MDVKLNDKNDYQNLFNQINQPLRRCYQGKSRIFFGTTGVGYGNRIAGMEGFARMLWGAGPILEQLDDAWQLEIKQGILAGTDPDNIDYWGELHDRDQRMVEMPAIALALLHNNQYLWHQLSVEEQQQVATWLAQIFDHECSDGNWQFFKILVHQILQQLGIKVGQLDAQEAVKKIQKCYKSDGWYQDSARGRIDYYTPFAFQYYGILYSALVPNDPLSSVFRQRAREFAMQFIHFFAEDGANVPFGRSLTYRYAAVAFWVAVVYGDILPEQLADVKGIINRNLRWWLERPIFDSNHRLTLGYGYAQLLMTEPYNSPTSPYWSNKIFLLLALPKNHPYWEATEAQYPKVKQRQLLAAPHLLASHDKGHTVLLNAGQPGPNYHALTNEKYFKFAYSSQFGFSIPRGNQLKEELVMDSMIGVQAIDTTMMASRGGQNSIEPGMFYTRNNVSDVVQTNAYIGSTWQINPRMQIRTWLTTLNGWQIRIHKISLRQTCAIYETGFSIADSVDNPNQLTTTKASSAFTGRTGFSGITDLTPIELAQEDASIHGFPNTNLMTAEVVTLPGRQTILTAGEHWLVSGVYAHQDRQYAAEKWQEKPIIDCELNQVIIRSGNDEVVVKTQ